MLVTGDKVDEAELATHITTGSEIPPPYESVSSSAPVDPSDHRHPLNYPRPPDIPATNCIRIKRKNASIKGTYVIDAGIYVPDELLSESGAARRAANTASAEGQENLYLDCTNGNISADVWLIGDGDRALNGKRAKLELKAKNGSLDLKLASATTYPFALNASIKNGTASVALPSDFSGPVFLSAVNGSVSLSSSMESRLRMLSEEDGIGKFFIGDYNMASNSGGQNWMGSTVDIGGYNSLIKLFFVDENEENATRELTSLHDNAGFWKKLLGAF